MTLPPASKQATCQAVKADGSPCRAGVKLGASFCFVHDPDRAVEVHAARIAGGIGRNKPTPPAEPIDLSTPELQRRAIEQTIDRVRAGDESVSIARLVLYGISLARPIVENEDIIKRLEALEGLKQCREPISLDDWTN